MAEVVESKVCDPGILQSSFEGSADALKRPTLIGEDMSGDGFRRSRRKAPNLGQALQSRLNIRSHRHLSSSLGLCIERPQCDKASLYIDPVPSEADNFTEPLS